MGMSIILPTLFGNPNLPAQPVPSDLVYDGALGVYEMWSQFDQSSNGHDLAGSMTFDINGLQAAGGGGPDTGISGAPASGSLTIVACFNATNSANANVVSSQLASSGLRIFAGNNTLGVQHVNAAAGAPILNLSGSGTGWRLAIVRINDGQVSIRDGRGNSQSLTLTSNPAYGTANMCIAGAPAGATAITGITGSIGFVGIYDGDLWANYADIFAKVRVVMSDRGVTVPSS